MARKVDLLCEKHQEMASESETKRARPVAKDGSSDVWKYFEWELLKKDRQSTLHQVSTKHKILQIHGIHTHDVVSSRESASRSQAFKVTKIH